MSKCHLVFNLSDYYVPYFSVCLLSLLKNISADVFYQISILECNICESNKHKLQSLLPENVKFEFINIKSKLIGKQFQPHSHVSVETFFKLFIPSLFKECPRVLFCDADIIFNRDPSELFSVDFGDNKLAATPCLLWRGIMANDLKTKEYTINQLNISEPSKYFQCGVLMFNIKNITQNDIEAMLSFAQSGEFACMDQDILNRCFYGHVLLLNNQWNYETSQRGFMQCSIPFMDENTLGLYNKAKQEPYVIHYSGAEKPWLYRSEEYADVWWKYAEESPWYSQIVNRAESFQMVHEEIEQLRKEFTGVHFPNINYRFEQIDREIKLSFILNNMMSFRMRKLGYKIKRFFSIGKAHAEYKTKHKELKALIHDACEKKREIFKL